MATSKNSERIDELIMSEQWQEARSLIEACLKEEPDSHWLLTQLAETHYEEREYKKALEILLRSQDILPDCPLTLWHLAGTLDALGQHQQSIRLYTWLIQSKRTPEDDPCWESEEWSDALKTDCIYRMGLSFKHLQQKETAAHCFRSYITLCMRGIEGSYSLEEAIGHLKDMNVASKKGVKSELQKMVGWSWQYGEDLGSLEPPELDRLRLLQLQQS